MGTPSTGPFPYPTDGDYYIVTVQAYGGAPPWNDCGGTMLGLLSCCQTGAQIKNWIKAQWHCSGRELCMFTGFTEQRIWNIEGPFPSLLSCQNALPY